MTSPDTKEVVELDLKALEAVASAVMVDPNHHEKFEAFRAAFRPATVLALLTAFSSKEEEYHRRGVKIIELTEFAGAHLCRAEAAEAQIAGWKRRHDAARTREDENYAAFERDSAALTVAEARIKALEEALSRISVATPDSMNTRDVRGFMGAIRAIATCALCDALLATQQEGAKP